MMKSVLCFYPEVTEVFYKLLFILDDAMMKVSLFVIPPFH